MGEFRVNLQNLKLTRLIHLIKRVIFELTRHETKMTHLPTHLRNVLNLKIKVLKNMKLKTKT